MPRSEHIRHDKWIVRYVAFVRNVMVGRQGLGRSALLSAFAEAGADEPVSYLATGNVSFACAPATVAGVGAAAQQRIANILGRDEEVFVRSLAALRRRVSGRPFTPAPWQDTYERCVSFTASDLRNLELPYVTSRKDACLFDRVGADVYSVTRTIGGRPGSPGKALERLLGQPVTTRNWNTIERIVWLHASPSR